MVQRLRCRVSGLGTYLRLDLCGLPYLRRRRPHCRDDRYRGGGGCSRASRRASKPEDAKAALLMGANAGQPQGVCSIHLKPQTRNAKRETGSSLEVTYPLGGGDSADDAVEVDAEFPEYLDPREADAV